VILIGVVVIGIVVVVIIIISVEKLVGSVGLIQQVRGHHAKQLLLTEQQILFRLGWEDGATADKLSQHTRHRPHVDLTPITQSKHDFGRSIISALDVGVNATVRETRTAKINNSNVRELI